MRSTFLAAAILGMFLGSATAEAAELVTECGQAVEGAARLGGDLDCRGVADTFIHMTDGSLDLAGHTLTADVQCLPIAGQDQKAGSCVIRGPGTIHGCVHGFRGLEIRNVDFSYFDGLCPAEYPSGQPALRGDNIRVKNVTISGYPGGCIQSTPSRRRGNGIVAIVRSHLQHYGAFGPAAGSLGTLRIINSRIEGELVAGTKAYLRNTEVTGAGVVYDGLWMHEPDNSAVLVHSSISGMAKVGIRGERIRLIDSSVSGSCGLSGIGACADLVVGVSATLEGSTCGVSLCEDANAPCGVCTGD